MPYPSFGQDFIGHPKHPKTPRFSFDWRGVKMVWHLLRSWFPTSWPHLQISFRSLRHGGSRCDCAATWILCSKSSGEEGQVGEDSSGKNRTTFLRWACRPTVGRKYDQTTQWLLIVNGILHHFTTALSWTLWSIPTTVVFHQAANCQREKLSERSNEKYSRKNIRFITHELQNYLQPPHWGVSWLHLVIFGVKLDSYGAASGLMICPKNLAFKFFWRYLQAAIRAERPKLRLIRLIWLITPTYIIRISSFYMFLWTIPFQAHLAG